MKKNKGFTLIELLAVIVILGILLSISTIAVNSIRKKQEVQNKENVISSILTGAKEYNAKNKIEDNVDVKTLKDNNYVDFDTNKYSDLYEDSITVTKSQCTDNSLKVKYSITVGNTTYNDCGCDEQPDINQSSDNKSSELCK